MVGREQNIIWTQFQKINNCNDRFDFQIAYEVNQQETFFSTIMNYF